MSNSITLNDQVFKYIKNNFHRTFQDGGNELKPMMSPCADAGFTSFFYWDTYFANLALIETDNLEQLKNNLDNMAYLLDKIGYIPNGYRPDIPNWVLTNRSQPPLFTRCVEDYYNVTNDINIVKEFLPKIEKEYAFWQRERITPCGLNKYGHSSTDEYLVAFNDGILGRVGLPKDFYKDKVKQGGHFLAIAESGWDFTPRFYKDDNPYACEDYAPVDLNSILFGVELAISKFNALLGNTQKADEFLALSKKRKALMDKLMKSEDGIYYDYDYTSNRLSPIKSTASFCPYVFGVSTDKAGAEKLLDSLLCEYGVPATEKVEGCKDQWAYPSVWPPQTYFVCKGLENVGSDKVFIVAEKYLNTVRKTYEKTGTLWEKYDCENGDVAVGHEYKTVEMFGWTAGVYTYLLNRYSK